MKQNSYFRNRLSKFIEVWGVDKNDFLQSIITNDIYKCKENNSLIYSCILSPQGKFLADFFISNHKNYYLIEIHEKYFDSFFNKLKIYKLRSKVEFKENKNLISLILSNNFLSKNTNFKFYIDPRNENIGKKIYIDKIEYSNLDILSNKQKLDQEDYREILMKNLVPNTTDDLIENKSLLLENNFQNINAISWNKGCYVGQEITARMKYRALLKKKLYLLKLISGNIQNGENIIINEINIGQVISKSKKYLLCMLKIELSESIKNKEKYIKINSSVIVEFL